MSIMRMQMQLEEQAETLARLEKEMNQWRNRCQRLERVWHNFRREHRIPAYKSRPIPIPPRPECLRTLGAPYDPAKETADAG